VKGRRVSSYFYWRSCLRGRNGQPNR